MEFALLLEARTQVVFGLFRRLGVGLDDLQASLGAFLHNPKIADFVGIFVPLFGILKVPAALIAFAIYSSKYEFHKSGTTAVATALGMLTVADWQVGLDNLSSLFQTGVYIQHSLALAVGGVVGGLFHCGIRHAIDAARQKGKADQLFQEAEKCLHREKSRWLKSRQRLEKPLALFEQAAALGHEAAAARVAELLKSNVSR